MAAGDTPKVADVAAHTQFIGNEAVVVVYCLTVLIAKSFLPLSMVINLKIFKLLVPRRLIFTALQWISRRPRSQNILKERTLNPEKDTRIKRPRSHVSSEKSSKNYKPLENWAKPNLLPDVTPQPANSFGDCIWRVCHVVKPEPGEFLAILISQINWPRRGERAGWIAVWSSSLTGW